MTSITIVRTDDKIVIASDGASYDDDGILRQVRSKVEVIPHLPLVIAGSGTPLSSELFRQVLFNMPEPSTSFDEILSFAGELCEGLMPEIEQRCLETTKHFTLYFCGYSAARGRLETYGLRSREWPDMPLANGEIGTVPPFTLIPLPSVFCAPVPSADLAEMLGIAVPGVNMTEMPEDIERYAIAAVTATRFQEGGATAEQAEKDPFCCVGAFIQLTHIYKAGSVSSQIVHKWPDVTGSRMNPEAGEPHERMPLWIFPEAAQLDREQDEASA